MELISGECAPERCSTQPSAGTAVLELPFLRRDNFREGGLFNRELDMLSAAAAACPLEGRKEQDGGRWVGGGFSLGAMEGG